MSRRRHVLGVVILLLLVAAVAGPIIAYQSWSELARIRDIKARGVETQALIERAQEGRRGRSAAYWVWLAWTDGDGRTVKAQQMEISGAFYNRIERQWLRTPLRVRIKYLPDAPNAEPIVMEDVGEREAGQTRVLYAFGGAGTVGIIGAPALFWLRRRRRTAAAAAPA